MVAPSTTRPSSPHHPTPEDPPSFERYDSPVDRDAAGGEDTPGGVTFVPLVLHPSFTPRRRISPAERKEALIKQAAIRVLAGLEPRSLREVAEEIGCRHTAIHNVTIRLCIRLGLRPVKVSDETRERMREARRRSLEAKSK